MIDIVFLAFLLGVGCQAWGVGVESSSPKGEKEKGGGITLVGCFILYPAFDFAFAFAFAFVFTFTFVFEHHLSASESE